MLTLLAKLFNALNSESSVRQIALAVALGMIVGISPLWSLHNLLIIFLVLFIRVHLGSFILAWGLFSGISYFLSFLAVDLGEAILTAESLSPLFTTLYQFNLFKFAHLHHTYTLGALVAGLCLAVPLYFLVCMLVNKYRVHVKTYIERFKIVKAIKASNFYRIYLKISGQDI